MEKITPEILEKTDDWRELYLGNGQGMIDLATELLGGSKKEQDLGLKIIEKAWFEEDDENPDSEPSLANVSFKGVIDPLEKLAPHEPRALLGLLVACRENVSVVPNTAIISELLEDDSKTKIHGMGTKSIAFRILVHACGRVGELATAVGLLKEHASFKDDLLEETGYAAASGYDLSSLIAIGAEDIQAKSEARVRSAMTLLRAVQKSGANLSEIVPYLFENQKRLGMFSDVLQVLGGHYLRIKKFDELEAWLTDSDIDTAGRAYLAVRWGIKDGADGTEFLARPGIVARLDAVMDAKRLPSQEEFDSF